MITTTTRTRHHDGAQPGFTDAEGRASFSAPGRHCLGSPARPAMDRTWTGTLRLRHGLAASPWSCIFFYVFHFSPTPHRPTFSKPLNQILNHKQSLLSIGPNPQS